MNKQQLAAKIWESANQMRSKIEANEYKDYILGFIFYKYISDKALQFAKKKDFSDEDIQALSEEDVEDVKYFQKNLGYFISYKHLFSTWIQDEGKKNKKEADFSVATVRDALNAFSRLIGDSHKKVYKGVLDTLQNGLSKLGESPAAQTKAIRKLLDLIKDIPMDGRQDYDVLGFIYEYLIGMFAANAGKKAGEFYTPHEVSLLMSEIAANHLKDRKQINIYDPTSGSGSLLINIGRAVAKHIDNKNNIKYYAQELKKNTYNLTRMNLVMRGILPNNIVTRNGDTLENDWPYFDENNSYAPLYVDVVVSNPPYSLNWDPKDKETDSRYARFGLAPKSKADYAFLLHDLYHLKPDGIMTIVLPHGVLFRGGEEGVIREKLIEANHIDAIIGLPSNIFFGTGIPTIIMVLKQKRSNTDVLIIDASKGFIKAGKNNKLRASDIKRIVDTVAARQSIPKFSRVVSREEIRDNEYNLNIPRYVDSSDDVESWDIYASMFGGIPISEIEELGSYWQTFPNLREDLFSKKSSAYAELKPKDVKYFTTEHPDVKQFIRSYMGAFSDFDAFLKQELLEDMESVNVSKEETILSNAIFKRMESVPLIDKYEAYQLLNDEWIKIAVDLEIIQTEGFEATRKVDPNMVIKKKNGKDEEVQDGWVGRIMPFDLVQVTYLQEELLSLQQKENRLVEISAAYEEIIDSLSEEEKEANVLNDSNDKFVEKELKQALKEIYADVESEEINALKEYLNLLENKAKKAEKATYINSHAQVLWTEMKANKDGTYSKTVVNKYVLKLQANHTFPEDSFESKMVRTGKLMVEEKALKRQINLDRAKLHQRTKETIEALSNEQVRDLLERKWIHPLVHSLNNLPKVLITELTTKVDALSKKYATTYADVLEEIHETEKVLSTYIGELEGNEYDMKGLEEFKSFLKGE